MKEMDCSPYFCYIFLLSHTPARAFTAVVLHFCLEKNRMRALRRRPAYAIRSILFKYSTTRKDSQLTVSRALVSIQSQQSLSLSIIMFYKGCSNCLKNFVKTDKSIYRGEKGLLKNRHFSTIDQMPLSNKSFFKKKHFHYATMFSCYVIL